MSLLHPDAQPSLIGRTRKILSSLANHNQRLREAFEWSDWIAALLALSLLFSWMRRWSYPEWLRSTAEVVHIVGAVLILAYLVLRVIFFLAKSILPRLEARILSHPESDLEWTPCASDVVFVDPKSDSSEYEQNLDAVVRLCHDSLGFEHDQFSTQQRRELYDRWCKANCRSILLLRPQFGMAYGQPIGVSIILPLTPEGLTHIQAKGGGVLKLDGKHILKPSQHAHLFLIDTLLLEDKWIRAYGPTALKALFHHMSYFYRARSWLNAELYCSIYQGGMVGQYLPQMRELISRRGFHEFGKTCEGETLFRMCLSALAADPLTKDKYVQYVRALRKCRAGTQRRSLPRE